MQGVRLVSHVERRRQPSLHHFFPWPWTDGTVYGAPLSSCTSRRCYCWYRQGYVTPWVTSVVSQLACQPQPRCALPFISLAAPGQTRNIRRNVYHLGGFGCLQWRDGRQSASPLLVPLVFVVDLIITRMFFDKCFYLWNSFFLVLLDFIDILYKYCFLHQAGTYCLLQTIYIQLVVM